MVSKHSFFENHWGLVMDELLNLEQLGKRLKEIDSLIITLALRRMELSKQVGQYKLKVNKPIVRLSIEDRSDK